MVCWQQLSNTLAAMAQHPALKRICVSGSALEYDAVIDIGSVGLVQNSPWVIREEA